MKLLLAAVAARAGSEEAALFLLDTMKDTDYQSCVNVHGALVKLFPYFHGKPPAWVVELSLAALADNRFVTGLEKTNFLTGTSFTVATCETRDLEFWLCNSKCTEAVPLLIERLKRGLSSPYTAQCLADMGDKRAVPCLMELAEAAANGKDLPMGEGAPFDFPRLAYALGKLRAREAVPLLLRHSELPDAIIALGEIGDPRVVPVLEKLVSTKGKIIQEGTDVRPDLARERLYKARVALAELDRENCAIRLAEIVCDKSLTAQQRADTVNCLRKRPDRKAVPYLVRVIKTEGSYPPDKKENARWYLIDMAIDGLGEIKCKAAVEGLIECFDLDFRAEGLGMGDRITPATYRNRIARSLQQITGQTFGADKQQWLTWWHEKGKQSKDLK